MAKPRKRARYPAKFRATLERHAAGKSTEAEDAQVENMFKSCNMQFLRPGQVDLLYAKLDDQKLRMTTIMQLTPAWRPDALVTSPPWASLSPAAA